MKSVFLAESYQGDQMMQRAWSRERHHFQNSVPYLFCLLLNALKYHLVWCNASLHSMLNFSHLSLKWSSSKKNKMFVATWISFLQGTGSHNSVIIFNFWSTLAQSTTHYGAHLWQTQIHYIPYLQSDYSSTFFFHHETSLWYSVLCLCLCVSFSCDISFDDHLGVLMNLKSV